MKDGTYLKAKEKETILKGFKKLVEGGFKREHFTKAMYRYLSLHFGFIAHYDIDGFYAARFERPEGRVQILKQILGASRWNFNDDNTSGCADLNTAIFELFKENQYRISEDARSLYIAKLKMQRDTLDLEIAELEAK